MSALLTTFDVSILIMKTVRHLILFVVVFLAAVTARPQGVSVADTIKIPISYKPAQNRELRHDYIDNEQKNILAADGKADGNFSPTNNDEINFLVTQSLSKRLDFRALVDAWGNRRPAGQRLVHRATDTAEPGAFTTSPLQTRYVPVGFMFFEGLPRLLDAGVSLPGLAAGDPQRIALEGYPGLVAHDLIGTRSYKNRDSDDRRAARLAIVEALEAGRGRFATTLRLADDARRELLDDASGDRLDAVLCLVQAAWAWRTPGHGLPEPVDPVEGWVTGARWGAGRLRC